MHLQENESLIKTFHHHPTVFLIKAFNYTVVSLPFFFVATFFSGLLNTAQMVMLYAGVASVFLLLLAYDLFFFYFDRLIITNRRILHVDWNGAFSRSEHEAELSDIQDIGTQEAGLLAVLPFFDFGVFTVETASTQTTIIFKDAPDPEGIKHFVYHLNVKPSRIGASVTPVDDTARYVHDEEAAVSRRQ
ncbi:PH domain-containing protein [Candidatus Peregrinibacteria bacterium]|nr:PH domain-containing protein [Candidatus Peregrinibacteria bacterium]